MFLWSKFCSKIFEINAHFYIIFSKTFLQGRWTDDWAKPENIRTMQRLRNRVQAHADRRNHNFMLREKNRVEQIQRHRISEDGIVDRGETDAGLAPQLNIPYGLITYFTVEFTNEMSSMSKYLIWVLIFHSES